MEKICKEQYEKDFDEMFKLDKNGLMTNIDCYVSNLENKINNLQSKIDKARKIIDRYSRVVDYDDEVSIDVLYEIDDVLKEE